MTRIFTALLAGATVAACSAWVPPNNSHKQSFQPKLKQDRREFLASLVVGSATPWLVSSPAAAATSQQQKDEDNIVKGYNRLQYLLANWEAETTVCKTGQEVSDMLGFLCKIMVCTPTE
mmetsp:Transcript_28295/g.68133  ORF Transcript_28295/g.68133 Transcript_28295/m.68133 type:complete len:119 (-) Transcript_28295:480-836(-)